MATQVKLPRNDIVNFEISFSCAITWTWTY